MPSELLRFAIYTRQSVDKGDEFTSCDVQFQTCQDSANAAGGSNMHWIGQRFDDHGYSGTTLDRPAMRKLRKVIDLGGIDVLYAVALDRLTRSMRDAVLFLDELEKAGVELRLVHQSKLTSGPENHFLKHVLAAFAEFERDMIATRTADIMIYTSRSSRRLAGPPPFGYDAEPITKQLGNWGRLPISVEGSFPSTPPAGVMHARGWLLSTCTAIPASLQTWHEKNLRPPAELLPLCYQFLDLMHLRGDPHVRTNSIGSLPK